MVYEWLDLHIFQKIDGVLTEENLLRPRQIRAIYNRSTVFSQQGMLSRHNQELEYEPSSIAVSASIIIHKQVYVVA